MKSSPIRFILGAVFLHLTASAALAQATIAGVVRDSSGAVLPGVSLRRRVPSLTEKVRTALTDGTGQYRIVTLPPGSYVVTFSLTGFTTVKRDNVSVSGSGVIPINAELRLGSLQETITVSGESPLVDTQTTRRETVINSETINALPITRNYGGVLYATPGLVVQPGVNANALMPSMALFSAHGGISTEGRVFVDGVSVNGPFGQNSVTQFAFDVGNAQEMQVMVGGGLGESETGGPVANIIPRSGGNTFSGSAFFSGTQSNLQSDNITDDLQAQGIPTAPTVRKNWDSSGALGGPIARDRLWFFGNVRTIGIAQVVAAGMAPNLNLGDATRWDYAPTPGVETRFAESKFDLSVRLTGQVTPKNRVTFSYQPQYRCLGSTLTTNADGCRVRDDDWIGVTVRCGDHRAGSGSGLPGRTGQPDAGDVDVTGLQQPPARRGRLAFLVRHHRLRSHAARFADGFHRRAGNLQHVRSCQQLVSRPVRVGRVRHRLVELARVVVLCDRRPQREAWIHRHGDEVRLGELHQSQPDALHVQLRRAGDHPMRGPRWQAPVSDRGELHDHGGLRERQSSGCAFDIHAGSVDARPDDAARCAAVGLRVQLGAGRGQRHGLDEPLHIDAHPVPGDGERDRATTISVRALVSRTISSATAGPL